jgi:hypothetical protein
MRTKIFLKLMPLIIICSSCATILNKKKEKLTILSKTPTQISIGNNGIYSLEDEITINVPRSKKPLKLSISVGDSLVNFDIKAKNSGAYFLNFYPFVTTFIGLIIDSNKPERYSYPRYLSIYNENQTSPKIKRINYKYLDLKNNLKITTLRLFDFAAPTIETNIERKINDKFTAQLMLGAVYNLDMYSDFNDKINKISGHRKGLEIKYFLKKTAPIGPYISLGYQNLRSELNTIMRFEKSEIDSNLIYQSSYPDSIKVTRKINALNLKFGYQIVRQKFVYDLFIGTGIRHRNVLHSDRLQPKDFLAKSRHGSVFEFVNQEGKRFTGSLSLNLKIGYAF